MSDWRKRCEELEEELRRSAAALSHDVRAPLRAVHGFSQALLQEFGGQLPERAHQYLGWVLEGASRMGRQIDALVELARLATQDLHRQPLDLAELARRSLAQLQAAEPERRVQAALPETLPVLGDGRLLGLLLDSLLGNAWKFTRAQSDARIQLDCRVEGEERIFFVADNGVGFEMGSGERLFLPFSRFHPADVHPGLGVGLCRARQVVLRHGGRIWAESRPGQGATFRFTLPGEPLSR